MDWLNQLGGVLQQYASANAQNPSENADRDFDQVATTAPRQAVAGGIAEAFRSDQTPPFPNMLANLFGNSSGTQRAGLLNTLLATAGPALASGVLSRMGSGGLAGILQGGGRVTPEQAEQIPPEAVGEIAREAEKQNPGIVDQISDFYAEHPTLVKTLGAAALTLAMSRMAKQGRPGLF
jgi:hypothetical protein